MDRSDISFPRCPDCGEGPFKGQRGLKVHLSRRPKQCSYTYRRRLLLELRQLRSVPDAEDHQSPEEPEIASCGEQNEDIGRESSPTNNNGPYFNASQQNEDIGRQSSPTNNNGPYFNASPFDDEDEEMQEINNPYEINVQRDPDAAYTFEYCGTLWERMKAAQNPNNPFFPFHSAEEFEIVEFLATAGLSQANIDKFLKLSFIKILNLSFRNASQMYKIIEEKLPQGPEWQKLPITLEDAPNDPQTLYFRNIDECAVYLVGNPAFKGQTDYEPKHVFLWDGRNSIRVFNEMSTGDKWMKIQRDTPEGTTLLPVILGSDKCILSRHTGDRYSWPVYMSIANIRREARNKPTRHAWMLVGLLPVTKFPNTHFDAKTLAARMPGILKRQLFHRCMQIILRPLQVENQTTRIGIDAEGMKRHFVIILFSWLADLEEQWLITALNQTSCPRCLARESDFGSHVRFDQRTGDSIVDALVKLRRTWKDANLYQFSNKAIPLGYSGVEPKDLCWSGLGVDICDVVCVDMLHGLHKFTHDHLLLWIQQVVGVEELDRRLQAQVYYSGRRTFKSGVSKLTQMSGRENRELERHLFVAIAGAETSDGGSLDHRVFIAVRALFDFIWRAQLREQTDGTLDAMTKDLATFHSNKEVFIDLGARVSEAGNVLDHFNFPKMHMLLEYTRNITDLGAADNFGTEVTESMHRFVCHQTFEATNKKDYEQQMVRNLNRQEALSIASQFYRWRQNILLDDDSNDWGDSEDEDHEDTAGPMVEGFYLSKRPHATTYLADVVSALELYGLPGAIQRYVDNQDIGVSSRSRFFIQSPDDAPYWAQWLRIWYSGRLVSKKINHFYPPDSTRIYCRYHLVEDSPPALFDTVLIEINGSARTPQQRFRVAELKLLFDFKLTPCEQAKVGETLFTTISRKYAFVHWFSPPLPASSPLKLHEVSKQHWDGGRSRACGIVPLSSISYVCTLAPILEGFCDGSTNCYNALETHERFFINPYASHSDFNLWKM